MILKERIATLRWKSALTTLELIKYPVTYSIEVSTDRGRIWVQLIADLQQTCYDFDIVDLDLGTLYQFRVKAHNAFGSSRATDPLEFLRGICKK